MTMLQHGLVPSSGGYQIERSLRFNSADSAYLNRTPASAGNRKTWTLSCWVKRSNIGVFSPIFTAATIAPRSNINFRSDDAIEFRQLTSSETDSTKLITTQVFRDVGAWYHLVFVQDTTQATSSNRAKMYVNGVQVTAFSTATYPSQDFETLGINNNVVHEIGRYASSTGDGSFPGYMTEIYFIDGSAKTPSDFGETDTDTGVWKPKAYSGSYGTNGFYLKFADNSGTTSTTLGKDSSGNGNNWTPNNFYVGPGTTNAEKAGIDSLVDTPTPYGTDTGAGGEVRGNYCVVNPLDCPSTITLSNGNLNVAVASGVVSKNVRSTLFATTGKWYWETTVNGISGNIWVGIATSAVALNSGDALNQTGGYSYGSNGNFYSGTSADSTPNTYTTNDVIGCAWNADSQTIQFFKNGVSEGTLSSLTAATYSPAFTVTSGSDAISVNFGQRPFAYTAPSGFKALCTQNLPTPDIGATATTRAGKYFNTVTYSGTGTNGNSITGVGFQPDFVWIKPRSVAASHYVVDAVRGLGTGDSMRVLDTTTTASEYSSENDQLRSFNSDGFTLDDNTDNSFYVNRSGDTYVAWNWKANGAGSTNNAGSIQSTVSANTTAGFSIVTYTGNGSASATVGHGLTSPAMVIVKRRSTATLGNTDNWVVKHTSLAGTQQLRLNQDGATYNAGDSTYGGISISASTFGFLTGTTSVDAVNENNATYVAYCFAPVAGYSAFGSYVANGSTDGNFIYTGMAPRFVLIKCSSTAENWVIFDTARDTYNVAGKLLRPNLSDAELDSPPRIDILSNGFKVRASGTALPNTSGATYIYMALAANPFKYSLAR